MIVQTVKCPCCNVPAVVRGERAPREGDVTYCTKCETPLRFGSDNALHTMTEEQLSEAIETMRALLARQERLAS